MNSITDTRMVITGAFGILGAATAAAAAKRGARLALIDFAAAPPSHAEEYGQSAVLLAGVDLSNPAAATAAVETAAGRLSGIDVVINIAGTFRWAPIADGAAATWDDLYRLNTMTALNVCVAGLPHLRRSGRGSIVNIGANAALKAGNGMGPYAASKSGVHKLTESLAEELKAERITVNAVLPSIIDTPANRRDMATADFSTWVSPASLADVILFLASDAARDITGALLPVLGRV